MNWYKLSQLNPTEHKSWNGRAHQMNLEDDQFIHFTTQKRAEEILGSGKLMINAPYPGFGAYGAFAISTTYGSWKPGVQSTHIPKMDKIDDSPIVGILFKTDMKPIGGYQEEVTWYEDVPLVGASIISVNEAKEILDSQENNILEEDDNVFYHDTYEEWEEYNRNQRQNL
jgi:hypothetical protein